MKLFAVYIGGKTDTSLIEVHDMRFTIGETLEDTFADLRASWWGKKQSLHMDCWGELTSADGYNVVLKQEPSKAEEKLFFVNLGGYILGDFNEQHKNVFVVATDDMKAKTRALEQVTNWQGKHKDALYEVEHLFNVNLFALSKGMYIHLEKAEHPKPFVFEQGYFKLG